MELKTVRISPAAHAKLKALAAKERRQIGLQMEIIIDAAVDKDRDNGA